MKAVLADVLTIALYNESLCLYFVQTTIQQVSGPQFDEWRNQNVCYNR